MDDITAVSGRETRANTRDATELRNAARDFEALLVGTMLKAGSKPLGGETLLDGGSAGRMYREMLLEELSRQASHGQGYGIAEMLESQLRPLEGEE